MRRQELPHIWGGQGGERGGSRNIKTPSIPRNDWVEGTERNWIRCFLSKVMVLWFRVMFSPK